MCLPASLRTKGILGESLADDGPQYAGGAATRVSDVSHRAFRAPAGSTTGVWLAGVDTSVRRDGLVCQHHIAGMLPLPRTPVAVDRRRLVRSWAGCRCRLTDPKDQFPGVRDWAKTMVADRARPGQVVATNSSLLAVFQQRYYLRTLLQSRRLTRVWREFRELPQVQGARVTRGRAAGRDGRRPWHRPSGVVEVRRNRTRNGHPLARLRSTGYALPYASCPSSATSSVPALLVAVEVQRLRIPAVASRCRQGPGDRVDSGAGD